MTASDFRLAFLTLFGLGFAVEWALNALNRKEARRHQALPAAFAGLQSHFDADTFSKSRAYTLDRLSLDTLSLFYSSVVTLVILFSGILPWADALLARHFGGALHRGVLFLSGVMIVQSVTRLPLTLYSTFRIEGKYGFNTMTLGLFWKDLMREFVLSIVLGLPLLYALLALLRYMGPHWWIWAFALLLAFQIVMMVVYPIFIAPLFNKFKPMEEGDLKTSLVGLANTLRFPTQGIYVMDGSRRSQHSNAYFTGFGRLRRIVLFDTLIGQMDPPELRSVLAHEIGHYKRKHIYKMMAAQIVMMGLMFFLASRALAWPPLYQAFRFNEPSAAVGLFLFMSAFSSFSIFFAPIQNLFSRKHEYEADAYAVESCRDREAMSTALIKLSRKNLSNLTPHPWYSAFHYSHPTLTERLKAIQAA